MTLRILPIEMFDSFMAALREGASCNSLSTGNIAVAGAAVSCLYAPIRIHGVWREMSILSIFGQVDRC